MDTSELLQKGQDLITTFGIKIIATIAIFVIGRWIAKVLTNLYASDGQGQS